MLNYPSLEDIVIEQLVVQQTRIYSGLSTSRPAYKRVRKEECYYAINIWTMKTAFQDWCEHWAKDPHAWLDGEASDVVYACEMYKFLMTCNRTSGWHRMVPDKLLGRPALVPGLSNSLR